jgi:hypothetical protein
MQKTLLRCDLNLFKKSELYEKRLSVPLSEEERFLSKVRDAYPCVRSVR